MKQTKLFSNVIDEEQNVAAEPTAEYLISQVTVSNAARGALYNHFEHCMVVAHDLNRKLVSFQSNKEEPFYRWFKYKEGFSTALVKYFLEKYGNSKTGHLLDPFAGAGTSLFAASESGWKSTGIELLPVGIFAIEARSALAEVNLSEFKLMVADLWKNIARIRSKESRINHISITKHAFPEATDELLNKYLLYCERLEDRKIQRILRFVAFTVLEDISYTRKDGQYLRWDSRCTNRQLLGKKPFNKGKILHFQEAIDNKLSQIISDLSPDDGNELFEKAPTVKKQVQEFNLIEGSCLESLPKIETDSVDFVITSPPYCNRYDYTRTYALELVFLGYNEEQVKKLRQSMLSCTVENKEKVEALREFYTSINRVVDFENVIRIYNNSAAMTEVNDFLQTFKSDGKLNNDNIARMVKNYFFELCIVIMEMSRILRSGAHVVMVNDNVQYGGEEVPVDLILSEFAENLGFKIKNILVLPRGKGNSSQQMGVHGRTEIRKCVYIWEKI